MNEENRKLIVYHRIENAHNTLKEVSVLMNNELWNTAVNRLYYACYYAVTALLIANNIDAHTHAGVRQMLALHFVKTGIITKMHYNTYGDLFEKRQSGDYEDFVFMTKEIVEDIFPKVVDFINVIIQQINLE
jgi:uncharacterized protein (UPF0332 family)